jgi:hypothetical protein
MEKEFRIYKHKLILNKGDKRILKKYLKYYADKLEVTNYSLSEDFIGCTPAADMEKYYIGMRFMVGQMQHELNNIKTVGEQQEIDRKWDLIKDRNIIGEEQ